MWMCAWTCACACMHDILVPLVLVTTLRSSLLQASAQASVSGERGVEACEVWKGSEGVRVRRWVHGCMEGARGCNEWIGVYSSSDVV